MAIYAKFDKFKGSATEDSHKEWIELESFSWGANRAMVASGTRREASHPTVQEVHFTKVADISTNKMLMDLFKGHSDNKVDISFTTMVNGKAEQYMLIKLEHAAVTNFTIADSSGGGRAQESVSLNYLKFTVTGKSIDSAGKSSPDTVGWDLAVNKPI